MIVNLASSDLRIYIDIVLTTNCMSEVLLIIQE